MRTLVDTSAWIEFFNRGDGPVAERVAQLVADDEALVTGLICCEVLAGFRSEQSFTKAKAVLGAFVELDDASPAVRSLAVEIYRGCRRHGVTIRSLVDCLIAAASISVGLPILHRDRDYDAISRLYPLVIAS